MEYSGKNLRMWSRLGMNGVFGLAITELAGEYADINVLTADVCGYAGLSRLKAVFPQQYYNVGIAEQNLIGISAGLANDGFRVFATTYASFLMYRCLDQIKLCLGSMHLPVILVGLSSGLSAGILGATHTAVDDISILRNIDNMIIMSPADCTEEVKILEALVNIAQPVYIRLTGNMNTPMVYKEDYNFKIGKAVRLCEGTDMVILATGTMVATALEVRSILSGYGINSSIFNIHTLRPLDEDIIDIVRDAKFTVTIEEHSVIGGLGDIVLDECHKKNVNPKLLKIGIEESVFKAAHYEFLLNKARLEADTIAKTIFNEYSK